MMKGKSKNQAAPEISFSDPATMPIYALLIQMGNHKAFLTEGGLNFSFACLVSPFFSGVTKGNIRLIWEISANWLPGQL